MMVLAISLPHQGSSSLQDSLLHAGAEVEEQWLRTDNRRVAMGTEGSK
jgi:hypothetical protein